MIPHPRHIPSEKDQLTAIKTAQQICRQPFAVMVRTVAILILENASLTEECAAHREARGLEPLPKYQPKFK